MKKKRKWWCSKRYRETLKKLSYGCSQFSLTSLTMLIGIHGTIFVFTKIGAKVSFIDVLMQWLDLLMLWLIRWWDGYLIKQRRSMPLWTLNSNQVYQHLLGLGSVLKTSLLHEASVPSIANQVVETIISQSIFPISSKGTPSLVVTKWINRVLNLVVNKNRQMVTSFFIEDPAKVSGKCF